MFNTGALLYVSLKTKRQMKPDVRARGMQIQFWLDSKIIPI